MYTLANHESLTEIERRVRALRVESPRQWGRMTVGQMVCHLTDGYRMATGERPVRETSSTLSRTALKWIALRVPIRWPRDVPTAPEADARRGGTRPAVFEQDVARLEQSLRSFVEAARAGRCGCHPYFGRMSPGEWLRWGYLHGDHHLRQFGA